MKTNFTDFNELTEDEINEILEASKPHDGLNLLVKELDEILEASNDKNPENWSPEFTDAHDLIDYLKSEKK